MSKVRIFLTFFSFLILVQGLNAQTHKTEDKMDLMNLIRREKFDLILPQVMRDNNIDMWIHVIREGDPLSLDLGSNSGVFIFTDRGGDRIERAVLGYSSESLPGSGAYDIFAREEEVVEGDACWEGIIGEFVAERDPGRIAVNFSERLAPAAGISYTDYRRLVNALGDKYVKRMVSADYLIVDFLSGRVMSEIVLYGQLCKISAEIIGKSFDVIEPCVTTLKDVSVRVRDNNNKIATEYGCEPRYRLGSAFVHWADKGDRPSDYVIQRGDLVHIAKDVRMMSYTVHIDEIGYVLREGETGLPPEVQKILEHGLKCREICRKNIKVGRTAGETLEILKRKLEEAGYIYVDRQRYDRSLDPEKTQVAIDFHALGRLISYEDSPRIAPLGPDWIRDLKIPLYHTFTFEYMIYMPVPEWGRGKHLYICLHDGVMVTERGVEFPYPPLNKIRAIR